MSLFGLLSGCELRPSSLSTFSESGGNYYSDSLNLGGWSPTETKFGQFNVERPSMSTFVRVTDCVQIEGVT